MYLNDQYHFDLDSLETARSEDVSSSYKSAGVYLGGLSLPIQALTPKVPKYDIRTRNWVSKDAFGRKSTSKTVKINKDKSTTTTTEEIFVKPDGTKVRKINEVTIDDNPIRALMTGTNPYQTLDALFTAAQDLYRGSHTVSVSSTTPSQFPRSVVRKTVVSPPKEQKETTTTETTVFVPTADPDALGSHITARKSVKTSSRVRSDEPKYFAKPVIQTTITGDQFKQFFSADNKDVAYHNDEMASDGSGGAVITSADDTSPGRTDVADTEVILDQSTNTRITKDLLVFTDADGNRTEQAKVTEEPLYDPVALAEQAMLEEGKSVSESIRSPLKETTKSVSYNKFGTKLRETNSETVRTPQDGETTEVSDVSSDGTETSRVSTRVVDDEGKETVNETEIVKRRQQTITTTRTDAYNYDEGYRVITLARVTTQIDGDTRNEEKVFRVSIGQSYTTAEEILEQKDDAYVDHIVHGNFITEFEFSGDLLEPSIVHKLTTKNFEHQQAWAMYEFLDQQLDLGDRLSPEVKRQIYIDQYRIFSGNNNQSVRGGPVLDRIALQVFTEDFIQGCVFSPQNGFKVDYIPGTDQMYRWSISVRVYRPIVKGGPLAFDDWAQNASLGLPVIEGVYNARTTT